MIKTMPFVLIAMLLTAGCGTQAIEKGKEAATKKAKRPEIEKNEGKTFVSMFNGKDLTGWEGKPGGWRVEEGAITGESTPEKPCRKTHYLIWKGGQPQDFVLRAKVKLSGGNSGIQFRSEARPEFDTDGYQADFDARHEWSGCLYQHRRGAVVKRGKRATISEDGSRKEEAFASFDGMTTRSPQRGAGSRFASTARRCAKWMTEMQSSRAKMASSPCKCIRARP
jgi:hypothetical protein